MEIVHNARVSVIMPSYNCEKYITDAIKSVVDQTFSDWELLILDDASTDNTVKVARAFESADPRIRVYEIPENSGVARLRNRGIELSKGEWIALLDSDDIWHIDKLEKQLKKAETSRAQIVYTSYMMFADGAPVRKPYRVPRTIDYEGMLKENVIGCSTVLLRRELLRDHPFSTGVYHEDYALWLELLRSGAKAVGCTEMLVEWREVHTGRSFDKRTAAKNRWIIYRRVEKLQLLKSIRVFWIYAWRGFAKHKRL